MPYVGVAQKRWTVADEELGRQLLAQGAGPEVFLEKLGRSKAAAHMHFYYNKKDERVRWRRPVPLGGAVQDIEPGTADQVRTVVRPTSELLAEARARAQAPRSITAWQCGDPPPGYSALDKIRKNQCAES